MPMHMPPQDPSRLVDLYIQCQCEKIFTTTQRYDQIGQADFDNLFSRLYCHMNSEGKKQYMHSSGNTYEYIAENRPIQCCDTEWRCHYALPRWSIHMRRENRSRCSSSSSGSTTSRSRSPRRNHDDQESTSSVPLRLTSNRQLLQDINEKVETLGKKVDMLVKKLSL